MNASGRLFCVPVSELQKKKSLLIDFCSSASHKFCRRAGRAVELPHGRTSKGPSSATARVVEERDWGGREKSK